MGDDDIEPDCKDYSEQEGKDIDRHLFRPFYAFQLLLEGIFTLEGGIRMEKRLGVVAIVVEDLERAEDVNAILHEFSSLVVGRMGIPYRDRGVSVISLIVDGTTDEISAMTGKLGKVKGVSVKSALTKK